MIPPLFTPDDLTDLREMEEALSAMFGVKMPGAVTVTGLGGNVRVDARWIDTCESLRLRLQQWLDQQPKLGEKICTCGHFDTLYRMDVIDETDLSEG